LVSTAAAAGAVRLEHDQQLRYVRWSRRRHIGYNYQMKQASSASKATSLGQHQGSTSTGCPVASCTTGDNWLSTVRGRLGLAADRFMPYITGGAAFGDVKASGPGSPGLTRPTPADARRRHRIRHAGHWTAKAEYLYVNLGNVSCGAACGCGGGERQLAHQYRRVGLNYRF